MYFGRISIKAEDVFEELSLLNNHKCGEPDNLPAIPLKEGAASIAPSLAQIFNLSIQTSSLPRNWTRSNVEAIFKKGDKRMPNNYKPISLIGHVDFGASCKQGNKKICRTIFILFSAWFLTAVHAPSRQYPRSLILITSYS